MKMKATEFNRLIMKLANETYHEEIFSDSATLKTLQSIDRTLKRLEVLIWKGEENRSASFDVPALYQQMSAIGLVGSHAEQE